MESVNRTSSHYSGPTVVNVTFDDPNITRAGELVFSSLLHSIALTNAKMSPAFE